MPILKRTLPGLICGLLAGTLLAGAIGSLIAGLTVAAILGAAYGFALPCARPREGATADRAMTAAAFGLPLWGASKRL